MHSEVLSSWSQLNMFTYDLNCISSLLLLFICLITKGHASDISTPPIITAGPTYGSYKFNVLQHLSGISPYFDSNANELSPDPPQGCIVDKAIYLVRHGSIYANDYDYNNTIYPFLQRLQNFSKRADFSKATDLAFLVHWTSPISNSNLEVEKLTESGSKEAFTLGTQLAQRYSNLILKSKNKLFKIWASAANRTKESASALLAGLGKRQGVTDEIITVSEEKNQGANTFSPTKTCLQYDASVGSEQGNIWLKQYTTSIITRLNAMGSQFNFIANDVLAMQELCGYETVIRGSSPFCKIFTPEEWLSFEYYFDIKYHYSLGYGNVLAPSLGMPWVEASSDLLNYTTDTDQSLYINVVHREMPPLILTALNLFNDSNYVGAMNRNPTLPLDQINYQRAWKSSKFIPFLGHIALERLQCTSASYTGKFVRILVNSAPQALPGCANGPGASCPLAQYMDYVGDRDELYQDFTDACKMNHQNTTDVLSFL
ncbi:unnamed protein product [Adineta steineri]|uniref:3-phytase n=2 Tax=Adineta steineri TaxID=433720 RepID=A0A815D788_9BILA|nr:unnamed protein product [Adineta steineri]